MFAVHPSAVVLTAGAVYTTADGRSEEHTSELQSRLHLVCRLLLEKKKKTETAQRPTDRKHASITAGLSYSRTPALSGRSAAQPGCPPSCPTPRAPLGRPALSSGRG